LLKLGIGLKDHVILVQLGVNRRDLPLPEGVVKRVVDRCRQNSQPRRGIAVNGQADLQPAVLLIAGYVSQFGRIAQLVEQFL
jgi:hypothetical protein